MMVKEEHKEVKIGAIKELVPKDWNVIKLDTINKSGKPICYGVLKPGNYVENGIPLIKIENMEGNKLSNNGYHLISKKLNNEFSRSQITGGELLISIQGTIGRVAVVNNNFPKANISRTIARINLDNNNCSLWLKNYFLSKIAKDYMKIISSGSTRASLNIGDLRDFEILRPPLKEQKKIADILSSVDETIEKTDQVIEKTKELKKGLMQQLLTKGIGHDEFKKVRIGVKDYKVPINWEIDILGNLIKGKPRYGANSSAIDYKRNLPRYIRITDISDDGHLKDDDIKSISEEEAESYYLEENDIVFARTGATVGKTYIYKKTDGKCAYAGYLIRFKIDKSKVLPDYLLYVTHSYYYDSWVKSMIRATSQPNINSKEYASFELLLPPLEEQKKIANILLTVDNKIQKEEEYKEKLEELKKGLMQKLLTGEVRVKVAN